eukprot:Plantae.Rhodophyta-Rhodochaete_pulchella.ctg67898.p1 GENE.Plantae.Rhodophyta-Rhodochaete_pulchella.ctg67898~~Plantae.Rhodophyta-Rhodochaete_pulchella.ctg67898.p1  ORF type:complete len:355 (-),score=52.22 Plantae.Rhodophyta-Rhodochaete_pulchella.ctg67898:387-1451(-)
MSRAGMVRLGSMMRIARKKGRLVAVNVWVPWTIVGILVVVLLVGLGRDRGGGKQSVEEVLAMNEGVESSIEALKDGKGKRTMCVLQPILTRAGNWTEDNLEEHIGYKAFLKSFAKSIDTAKDKDIRFWVYYGYDVTDEVFGKHRLREAFMKKARHVVEGLDVEFRLYPLYGLHGRITAIWNMMAKDAYHEGCDYFFMSNDDMLIFTPGWARMVVTAFERRKTCKNFGIVRFVDEWASWAKFTFHVSTRMHMEIFNGVYYPVPYMTTHNDYWIHHTYSYFKSSVLLDIHVRNRVKDSLEPGEAPPRYQYDNKTSINDWVAAGRAHVSQWVKKHGKERCPALHAGNFGVRDRFEII